MAKVNEHGEMPTDIKSPVYRHSSETVRSKNDAGGEVPASDYASKTPPKREFLR
jgi:hypothetical protein